MKSCARTGWKKRIQLWWLGAPVLWILAGFAVGQQAPSFRIPPDAIPVAYQADLTIIPTADSFHGKLSIDLRLRHPVQIIWVHGTNLTIESAEVRYKGRTQKADTIAGNGDFIGFRVLQMIGPGAAELVTAYTGKVNSSGEGLFRRVYKRETYLLTQFEPDAARKVFPCFDEPGLKASWRFTLHIPNTDVGLTNAPIESEAQEANGMKRLDFSMTRPLPSYLVAIAVGPFDFVEAGRAGKGHTIIRIVTPKGESASAAFAAEVSPRVLEWFEDYLGIPYAFGKLDLVANPGCSSGGMEHPGLITFCGPQMLARPEQDSPKRQHDFTRVLAHELAHQWFGNLVTPAWWDDLWLSEGFANWLQGKYLNTTHPEWNFYAEELRQRSLTMQGDGLENSRSLHDSVNSKADISRVFGPIAYVKGAAVLAMLDAAAGDVVFRRALHEYLRQHEFGTATTSDLISAIRSDVNSHIAEVATAFVYRPGVPLVRASLKYAANGTLAAHFEQTRAVSVPGIKLPPETWTIPICFTYWTTEQHRECTILNTETRDIALAKSAGSPQWVQWNTSANGYFRTAYEEQQFDSIIHKGWDHLSVAEHLLILSDLYAAVLDGSAPASKALSATAGVANKLAPEELLSAVEMIKGIGAIAPSENYRAYSHYVEDTFGRRAHSVGWIAAPGEEASQRALRPGLLLFVAVDGDDQQLQAEARELASKWLADRSSMDSEIVPSVLIAAACSGDVQLFDAYLDTLHRTDNPREKRWLVLALGSFQDEVLEQRAEGLLLNHKLTSQQWLGLMTTRPARPEFEAIRFQFVKEHLEALSRAVGPDEFSELLGQLPHVAERACSQEARAEVESFFRTRLPDIPGAEEDLKDVLTSIGACARRRDSQVRSLSEYLAVQ